MYHLISTGVYSVPNHLPALLPLSGRGPHHTGPQTRVPVRLPLHRGRARVLRPTCSLQNPQGLLRSCHVICSTVHGGWT